MLRYTDNRLVFKYFVYPKTIVQAMPIACHPARVTYKITRTTQYATHYYVNQSKPRTTFQSS